jgi:hypothetical protein
LRVGRMVDPPGLVPHSLTRSLTPAAPHSSSGPGSFVFLALERKSLDQDFVTEALPQPGRLPARPRRCGDAQTQIGGLSSAIDCENSRFGFRNAA